jgi:hypothetical protein
MHSGSEFHLLKYLLITFCMDTAGPQVDATSCIEARIYEASRVPHHSSKLSDVDVQPGTGFTAYTPRFRNR